MFSIAALQSLWMGIQHLDPTVAAFISRLQTLVSVFLGVIFLKERFGRREIIGALLLIAGVVIIRISFDLALSFWFWVMVASGVFFGITEIFAKQAVGNLHPIPLNFVRNSIIAVFFIVVLIAQGQPLFEFQGTWWHVLAIGIAGPLLSRLSFLNALSRIEVSKAVLVNQTQPIFVFLISFTVLSVIPTPRELIGGLLILTGCVILIRGRRE
jgi:drug/metabolite transporter (DMT)-like permease